MGLDDIFLAATVLLAGLTVILKVRQIIIDKGNPYNWLRAIVVIAALGSLYLCSVSLRTSLQQSLSTSAVVSLVPMQLFLVVHCAYAIIGR